MRTRLRPSIIVLCVTGLLAVVAGAVDSTIDAAHPHSYAANAGWINMRGDADNGAAIGRYYCSGNMYGANVGWIRLGSGTPANGHSYANNSASDYGVNHDGEGGLRGYAYGANVGWLNFENTGAPAVDLISGNLSGYVWGANIGWISLSNAMAYVRTDTLYDGPDSDGDDLADAYEYTYTNVLTVLDGTGGQDTDGDGATDLQEQGADTDPLDQLDNLHIISLAVQGATNKLSWTCRPTRQYRLLSTNTLPHTPEAWADAGSGLLGPPPASPMTLELTGIVDTTRCYRVEAVTPLSE